MNSSKKKQKRKPSITKQPPPKGKGGGYSLGPRPIKLAPPDAKWITAKQVCQRYGDRSEMWLWRNIKNNPDFPKPAYAGKMRIFSVEEFDAYDRLLITKRIGGERTLREAASNVR